MLSEAWWVKKGLQSQTTSLSNDLALEAAQFSRKDLVKPLFKNTVKTSNKYGKQLLPHRTIGSPAVDY